MTGSVSSEGRVDQEEVTSTSSISPAILSLGVNPPTLLVGFSPVHLLILISISVYTSPTGSLRLLTCLFCVVPGEDLYVWSSTTFLFVYTRRLTWSK